MCVLGDREKEKRDRERQRQRATVNEQHIHTQRIETKELYFKGAKNLAKSVILLILFQLSLQNIQHIGQAAHSFL